MKWHSQTRNTHRIVQKKEEKGGRIKKKHRKPIPWYVLYIIEIETSVTVFPGIIDNILRYFFLRSLLLIMAFLREEIGRRMKKKSAVCCVSIKTESFWPHLYQTSKQYSQWDLSWFLYVVCISSTSKGMEKKKIFRSNVDPEKKLENEKGKKTSLFMYWMMKNGYVRSLEIPFLFVFVSALRYAKCHILIDLTNANRALFVCIFK